MGRRRKGEPKDRKVTARFSLEEYRRLVEEAQRRGEPVSALLREVVVLSIEAIQEKLAKQS